MRHLLAFPPRRRSDPWCLAPSVQMHLLPDGDIRACCRNSIPLGNITEQRLPEIWHGARRAEMQRQLKAKDTPTGCENCAAEVATEGRRGSYPEVFDFWVNRLGRDRSEHPWPVRMEFNLSNRCNLQCIQCSGDLSSSIRIHREGRPALPTVYDDQFFDDLRAFLPHLRHANFAGGEPFLGPENFRVWDAIAELTPKLECTINTNATIWNRRVEQVLERGRFSFIFSLDGIHKDTYESIRIDSDLDVVLRNIERFRDYAARRNTDVNINHCLMPQNFHEFGDLLLYAEERHIKVNVSVVRTPRHCSIAYLPPDEIDAIHRTLTAQSRDLLPQLRLNATTWQAEVKRIGTWAERGGPERIEALRGASELIPIAPMRPPPPELIAGLPREAKVDPDSRRTAVSALSAFADSGIVHELVVESGDVIGSCPSTLLSELGIHDDHVTGAALSDLGRLLSEQLGPIASNETEQVDANRIEGTTRFERVEVRVAVVPMRDVTGRAEHASVLLGIRRR
jgi:radical SAM protein with 4Fe4S-binding SPASM domain